MPAFNTETHHWQSARHTKVSHRRESIQRSLHLKVDHTTTTTRDLSRFEHK